MLKKNEHPDGPDGSIDFGPFRRLPQRQVGGGDGGSDGTLPIGGGNGNGVANRTLALNGTSPIDFCKTM